MEANLESPTLRLRREHRAPIVRDDEAHALAKPLRQRRAPLGRSSICAVQIVFRARKGDRLDGRGGFAGELEGKLQHLLLS